MKSKLILPSLVALQLSMPAMAAEEEVLLTIVGDRVDLLIEGEDMNDADDLVLRYYQLLPTESQNRLLALRRFMLRRSASRRF